ncbi:MAG: restriction endonuclease subunit S [Deltaproteobacteria bacterium]|nr:restriction endonuclease subunit S [Deltaproteobacteria bacterium]
MAVETLTKTVYAKPLPEGWRWVKLAELLLSLETGTRPKGGAIGIESGIPSVSAEHMTPNGTFDFTTLRYVPEDFYEQMPHGHIQHGDILIVKDGATTGKICIVREDFPYRKAVINEHVFLCRPDTTKVVPEYLFYWLWGADGYGAIRSSFQGAAIGGINQGFVKTITLPLPPLLEQQRIVSILREQMTAIERARAAAKARLGASEALPVAYLGEVFSKRVGSEGWQTTLLWNL